MKKLITLITLIITFTSCSDPGSTRVTLSGNESTLPDELKGLKVYKVATDGLGYVKVAVINNQINSTTYMVGKTQETTLIINNQTTTPKVIQVKNIIMENDSLIICRK